MSGTNTHLASRENIHAVPAPITQFVLSHISMSVTPVDRQFCLSAAEVHTQQWIPVLHLQYHEVLRVTFHVFRQRSLVQYKSVVLSRHQLQACMAVFALGQRFKPGPAVSVEAMLRLLASRSIETISTHTPSTTEILTIYHCMT